jgi:hypothetical protein
MKKTFIYTLATMVIFIPTALFGAQIADSLTKSPFQRYAAVSGPSNFAEMENVEADIALVRYGHREGVRYRYYGSPRRHGRHGFSGYRRHGGYRFHYDYGLGRHYPYGSRHDYGPPRPGAYYGPGYYPHRSHRGRW